MAVLLAAGWLALATGITAGGAAPAGAVGVIWVAFPLTALAA